MATILLPILPGELPPGYCFSTWQQTLVDFADNMSASLEAGMAFYNFGSSVPAPEFQGYPWLRSTDMRWYRYDGNWIAPVNYDLNERRLFTGSLVDLQTYDGGDTGVPSDRSGPMWEEDTAFRGRSPMGPGLISGSDPASPKTLALSESYGEGSHVLTEPELPTVSPVVDFAPATKPNFTGYVALSGISTVDAGTSSGPIAYALPGITSPGLVVTPFGSDDPHQTVHPVFGIFIIKWTGRAYRKI